MSTYINRVIEVFVSEELTGTVDFENWKDQLNNLPEYKSGMLYAIKNIPYKDETPKYHRWDNGWMAVTSRKKYWKMLPLWYSDMSSDYHTTSNDNYINTKDGKKINIEHFNCICNNGGDIRDYYFSTWGPYGSIRERGIAEDISEEAKAYIDGLNYKYGETYVTLNELCEISSKEFEMFKNKVKDAIINKKLDVISDNVSKIYNKLNGVSEDPVKEVKKDDEEYEEPYDEYIEDEEYDKFEYLWDEDFNQMMSIKNEVNSIDTLVDLVYGYVPAENIRIHYFFD